LKGANLVKPIGAKERGVFHLKNYSLQESGFSGGRSLSQRKSKRGIKEKRNPSERPNKQDEAKDYSKKKDTVQKGFKRFR